MWLDPYNGQLRTGRMPSNEHGFIQGYAYTLINTSDKEKQKNAQPPRTVALREQTIIFVLKISPTYS